MLPSSPSFYLSPAPAPAPALPLHSPPRRHACAPRKKRESDERAKEGGEQERGFTKHLYVIFQEKCVLEKTKAKPYT